MPSSLLSSTLTRNANEIIKAHGPITLTDNTIPQDDGEEQDLVQRPAAKRTYSKRIQDGISRQKYRKYQEAAYAGRTKSGASAKALRPAAITLAASSASKAGSATPSKLYDLHEGEQDGPAPSSNISTAPGTPAAPASLKDAPLSAIPTQELDLSRATTAGDSAVLAEPAGKDQKKGTRMKKGGRKLRKILSRRRHKEVEEGDAEIDVLYENQRGYFFFGVPHFSSKSLLQFDARPWLNGDLRPSPVTIHTAQVPDPGWRWEWKHWYVEMSGDVDEEGWQYSFMFQNQFAWHGNHPAFHSFVRRRRWIRKRVKRAAMGPRHKPDATNSMQAGHHLRADYFTIHSARPRSMVGSTAGGSLNESYANSVLTGDDEDGNGGEDIDDLTELMKRLKLARVDREKIGCVLKYIDCADDNTYYLAENMHHIMSTLIFQHSRRRLLALMHKKIDAYPARASERTGDENDEEAHGERVEQKMRNLERARLAADRELQQMEYWSDIKGNVTRGYSVTGADEQRGWDGGWRGLDRSGPGPAGEPEDDSDQVLGGNRLKVSMEPAR